MDKKIKCEKCSREVLKTSLKKHYLSKYCISHSKDEEGEIEIVDENCYINSIPSDVMYYVIGYIQDFNKKGVNIFGDLRLVCKNFNIEVIKYARLSLRKKLLSNYQERLCKEIPSFGDREVMLYLLSINRYIGGLKATNVYGVPQKTLKMLEKTRTDSKNHFGSKNILYNKDDVIIESLLLYNSYDNLKDELNERDIRVAKRREKMNAKKNDGIAKRTKELDNLLSKHGLVRRNDSKLCDGYINGYLDEDWTVQKIIKRTIEVNYLYNKLHMNYYIKIVKKEYENNCEYMQYTDIVEEAEQLALEKIGGNYPASIYKPIAE